MILMAGDESRFRGYMSSLKVNLLDYFFLSVCCLRGNNELNVLKMKTLHT